MQLVLTRPSKGSRSKATKEGATSTKEPTHEKTAVKTAFAHKTTFNEVKPLLDKYTCTSCHNTVNRQIGSPFVEIAKRGYSADKTMGLIYKPQLENWPDYATPMLPMGHVPKEDVQKIAQWIGSLGK